MNNESLEILGNGKLTVTLVHSASVKVSATVYRAWKSKIDEESKTWKDQHLVFHVYPGVLSTTLKVEGDNAKDVANARKTLDEVSRGVILADGWNVVWHPALNSNGTAYQKLKSIEKELRMAIRRVRSKRHLLFYEPPEKLKLAVRQVTDMLSDEPSKSYQMELEPSQFSRLVRGGFSLIEQDLGKNIAVFNIVSRTLTINGTQQQYDQAMTVMDGKHVVNVRAPYVDPSTSKLDCPICFCEADSAIQTSCKHSYCLECFEDYCKSTASTSKDEFRIKCQGDGGTCSTIFNLPELRDHLSSIVFENVLESAFHEYIQRHPESFHYCPTPDCGFVYRCTIPSVSKPLSYTCPNCLEQVCTSCHALHGNTTCAEYKDIASGGHAALQKLKKELNIKDCPKCTTPMEKTEGCNHMTCAGCKAHICWVCMAVFDQSGPCYDHMVKEHGGIGLGLERYV